MRILEHTPNQLKIKCENLSSPFGGIIGIIALIILIVTFSYQESSATLSCKKIAIKLINCQLQEARAFGLIKTRQVSIQGLQGAKSGEKEAQVLLLTSYSTVQSYLGIYNSSQATIAEINAFVKDPTKNFLQIYKDNRLDFYRSLFTMLVFVIVITLPIGLFTWILFSFNNPFNHSCILDKTIGKALIKKRILFGMKTKEYPINEIVEVRLEGWTALESQQYHIYLVLSGGEKLLLSFFVLFESKNRQKMARNLQEAIATLHSFLSLPESQSSSANPGRSNQVIKIKKSTPTKLTLAETKNLQILWLTVGILPLFLQGCFLVYIGINMLQSSSSEMTIINCDRQKNYCEIREIDEKSQQFPLSQLRSPQIYMAPSYWSGEEIYWLKLVKDSQRERTDQKRPILTLVLVIEDKKPTKKPIFDIPIVKSGKSSYQEIPEIIERVNNFIATPKIRDLTLKIWQGNQDKKIAPTLLFFGGLCVSPLGIILWVKMGRVNRKCTFDKKSGKLFVKNSGFLVAKVREYPLFEVREVQLEQNVGYEVVLVMSSGDRFTIMPSYWYLQKHKAEEIAEKIRAFLNLKPLR